MTNGDSKQMYQQAYSLHYSEQKPEEALALYRKVVEEYPTSQEANFAKTQISNIEDALAKGIFKKACLPNPKSIICSFCNSKVVLQDASYCPKCGRELMNSSGIDPVLLERFKILENKIANLESKLPSTSVLSNSFLKRAFAIYGHALVAGLMIGIPLYLLLIIISGAFSSGY